MRCSQERSPELGPPTIASMVQWDLQNSPVPWGGRRWDSGNLGLDFFCQFLPFPFLSDSTLKVGLLGFPIPFPSKFWSFKVLIKLVLFCLLQ